jgi:hypothetical protein
MVSGTMCRMFESCRGRSCSQPLTRAFTRDDGGGECLLSTSRYPSVPLTSRQLGDEWGREQFLGHASADRRASSRRLAT